MECFTDWNADNFQQKSRHFFIQLGFSKNKPHRKSVLHYEKGSNGMTHVILYLLFPVIDII